MSRTTTCIRTSAALIGRRSVVRGPLLLACVLVALSVGGAGLAPAAQASISVGFQSFSAGGGHNCGVRGNDTITCWGSSLYGESSPPAGTFKSVSAGWYFTCAVRTDDTVACWGYNNFGQSSPPVATFKSVSAGKQHTCAVRTDDLSLIHI